MEAEFSAFFSSSLHVSSIYLCYQCHFVDTRQLYAVGRMLPSPQGLLLLLCSERWSLWLPSALWGQSPVEEQLGLKADEVGLVFSDILFEPSAVFFRANESGSSPSGSSSTLMFIPSASSMSVPRMAAWIPAASPSYRSTMLLVKRCSIRIWCMLSAVPSRLPHSRYTDA